MKKLNKLQINSERLLKNNELITLRGGYDSTISCKYPSGGECTAYGPCVGFIMFWCYIDCPGTNRAVCS
jgi:hypothetical protein